MYDSLGRKINYLRISVTDRCNLRCTYCMPEEGVEKKPKQSIMRLDEVVGMASAMASMGIDKIRLTGGEPLIRKDILAIVDGIAQQAAPDDFAMTTNGLLLESMAFSLRQNGLKRLNISLDSLDPLKYSSLTRGGDLSQVLRGIDAAFEAGYEKVRINTVLVAGINDRELDQFVALTEKYPVDVRFIELMPIGQASKWSQDHFVPVTSVLAQIENLVPVDLNDNSSPATYYARTGMKGRIGLINPVSCSFCSNCNRIRITADGRLKTCLHGQDETDVLTAYRTGGKSAMIETVLKAIDIKPARHDMNIRGFSPIARNMNDIGG